MAGDSHAGCIIEVKIHRGAGIGAYMLQPMAARLPGHCHERGQKQAPGEEPNQVRQPIAGSGHLVVVVRIAQAKKAQVVLVDQVEVPETVHVADGRMVAHRVPLVGISQPH